MKLLNKQSFFRYSLRIILPLALFFSGLWVQYRVLLLINDGQLFDVASPVFLGLGNVAMLALSGFHLFTALMVFGQIPLFFAGRRGWVRWFAALMRVPMLINVAVLIALWLNVTLKVAQFDWRASLLTIFPALVYGVTATVLLMQDWQMLFRDGIVTQYDR